MISGPAIAAIREIGVLSGQRIERATCEGIGAARVKAETAAVESGQAPLASVQKSPRNRGQKTVVVQ
jgi:hypothetical protein